MNIINTVAMQRMFDKIQTFMYRVFPDVDPETTFLHPHNIDDYNILVDDEGDLVCVMNWSGLNVVPAWAACQLPCFLNVEFAKYSREPLGKKASRHRGEVERYEEDIETYEFWRLRAFFFEEMRRIEPKWVETFKESTNERDVTYAILCATNDWHTRKINDWLDIMLEGRVPRQSLADALVFLINNDPQAQGEVLAEAKDENAD